MNKGLSYAKAKLFPTRFSFVFSNNSPMNFATRLLLVVGMWWNGGAMMAQCLPDSLVSASPGVYPDSLSLQGCQYSESVITFVLPRDTTTIVFGQTFTVPFNFFRIESIQGLPNGVNWSCNLQPDCQYDVAPGNPTPDIAGCILLFGTPVIPGTYTIVVNLTANVTLLGNSLDQPATYVKTLTVGNCSFGSDCYTYSLDAVCAPAVLSLENDLDNVLLGNCDVTWQVEGPAGFAFQTKDLQPNPVALSEPGTYVLTFEAVIDTFPWQLDSIVIQSVNCSDLLDGPDLYWKFADPSGAFLLNTQGSPLTNATLPLTLLTSGLVLDTGFYQLEVWDADNVGGDDGCAGSAGAGLSFQSPPVVAGPNMVTVNGLTATFFARKPTSLTACTDTFELAAPPLKPVVLADTNAICFGDTLVLAVSSSDSLVWYKDFIPMADASDSTLMVWESGFYQVEVISRSTLCREISDWVQVEVVEVPAPSIAYDGNGQFSASGAGPGREVRWFNDQGLLQGTGLSFQPANSGIFYAQTLDLATGCLSAPTQSVSVILSSLLSPDLANLLSVGPNPCEDLLYIRWEGAKPLSGSWQIIDLMGRQVLGAELVPQGQPEWSVNTSLLPAGMYLLQVETSDGKAVKKIQKQ